METNRRLKSLPPFLFAELARRKSEAASRGADLIGLASGEPEPSAPEGAVRAAAESLTRLGKDGTSPARGGRALREAVARWYRRRHGVELDPEREVAALFGAKEGLARLPAALADEGDIALVPEPAFPTYREGALLAGLHVHGLPLSAANGYLPDLAAVPKDLAYKAKLLYLNYPHNPTGAVADAAFFQKAADWALHHQVWVAHDATLPGPADQCPSFLSARGVRGVGLEFGSLSKIFSMAGWRIGFVAGSAQGVQALVRLKEHFDSGPFAAVEAAAVWALDHGDELAAKQAAVCAEKRRFFREGLISAGWHVADTPATFYLWARPAARMPSRLLAERLSREGVLAAPGDGFGESGEGWLRFAVNAPKERLEEALRRISRMEWGASA